MKPVKNIIDFVLYSNVFIALCAVALVFTNQLTVGEPVQLDNSCWFVFFSTSFAYSALKFRKESATSIDTPHQQWAQQNSQLQRNILLLSLIGAGSFFITLNREAKTIVAVLGIITAFYGLIDIPFTNPKIKLRELWLLKTAFVGLVWAVTTVLVPFAGHDVDTGMLVFLLLRRFLFVMGLTIAFEVKDLKGDRLENIKTLPMVFGVNGTRLIAQGTLLLLVAITLFQYFMYELDLGNMLAVNISLLVSIICIQPVNEDTTDKWYYLLLDGMMLLQFVFVYVAFLLTA